MGAPITCVMGYTASFNTCGPPGCTRMSDFEGGSQTTRKSTCTRPVTKFGLNHLHWLTAVSLKLSVGVPGNAYFLEIEGLFSQRWRPGRTSSESVGGISKLTVLIGRTDPDTIPSIPYSTQSLNPVSGTPQGLMRLVETVIYSDFIGRIFCMFC